MPTPQRITRVFTSRARERRQNKKRAQGELVQQQLTRGLTIWTHFDYMTHQPRGADTGHVLLVGPERAGKTRGVCETLRTWKHHVLTLSFRDELAEEVAYLPEDDQGRLLHDRRTFYLERYTPEELEHVITELLERDDERPLAAHFVLKPWKTNEPRGAYILALERLFVWARLLGSPSLWVIEGYKAWKAWLDGSEPLQALLTSPGHARVLVSIRSIDELDATPFDHEVHFKPNDPQIAKHLSHNLRTRDCFPPDQMLEITPGALLTAHEDLVWVTQDTCNLREPGRRLHAQNHPFFINHYKSRRDEP